MGEHGENRARSRSDPFSSSARPTPSRRDASARLFPSRINCKSVSSLIFSFAMDTSWKHHGNFWFTAVIARLSLKMSDRQSAEKPGGEFERLQLNVTNIFHSTTRAVKRDREVGPASGPGGSSLSPHRNTWKLPGNVMEKYGNFWETVSIGAQKLFTAEEPSLCSGSR